MTDETKLKTLELAMAQIDKKFGAGSIMRLGDDNLEPIPVIPTGALTLDLALGAGGIPRGRIVEIYGPEATGKSTLALSVVANAQRAGGIAAYIDAEHALDPMYVKGLGVNFDDLLLAQPGYGEEALDICDTLVKTKAVDLVVIDSVAALIPLEELESDMQDKQMGAQARMMGKGIRKITANAADYGTTVIFINQLREKIGVMFANPETTPGGKALKFYASVRLDLRRLKDVEDPDGKKIGIRVNAKIVKNKVGPPFQRAEYDLIYGKGIDIIGCVIDLGVDKGVLVKSGAWFKYNDELLGQGRAKTIEALASDLDLLDEIKEKVANG